MFAQTLPLIESALAAPTAASASLQFFEALKKLGATYIQTRLYRRPLGTLTSAKHWAAGGLLARVSPDGWVGSAAFNYICFDCNPLLGAIRQNRTRYRFSDFAAHDDPAYGRYWEALSEAGISDALCATSYGPDRTITSLHLGFGRRSFEAKEARAIHMAGLMLTERLMDFAVPNSEDPALTVRERDCLAFVADGHTDPEIATLLGISETTVRFHLDNARRKLGAVNRAQAVARFASRGLM
jgi:LuxR family quorum sensing-dependent transcriptional regulator